MKQLHLFVFLTLVAFSLKAQKLDTIYSQVWRGNTWEDQFRYIYSYDASCKVGSHVTQQISAGGVWLNVNRNLFYYNASGQLTQNTFQNWDIAANDWENFSQQLNTYDVNGKQISLLNQNWNGDRWANGTRTTNTYDANGFLAFELTEAWDVSTWKNSQLSSLQYVDGLVSQALYQSWDGTTWQNSSRFTYTYTNVAGFHTLVIETWQNSEWINVQFVTQEFDADNYLSTRLIQNWNTDAWMNYLLETYTVDELGKIEQVLTQNWNNATSMWMNAMFDTRVYGSSCVLPLKIITFNAFKSNDLVKLQWETSDETNTDRIVLERSHDATHFLTIKTINASPGSAVNTYNYDDNVKDVKASVLYYRLKIVDKDGNMQLSNIISVGLRSDISHISIRPNPAKNYFYITTFNSGFSDNAIVIISDITGKAILQQKIISSLNKIDITALSPGVYIVQVKANGNIEKMKLVVQ